MRAHRMTLSKSSVESRNYSLKERTRKWSILIDKIQKDPDRHLRRADSLCPWCYYESSRIGGCAMTVRQCAFCPDDISSGNTNVDVICKKCAKQTGLCRHCGADINYVNRRSRDWPEQSDTFPDEFAVGGL